jgi:molybdate transport system substrate-binding protein
MAQAAFRRASSCATMLALVVLGSLVAGCGDDGDGDGGSSPAPGQTPAASQPAGSALSGDITVFAAASLTDAFNDIGDAFEAAHPDASVTFNFAGSPALVTQIEEGAAADVLATAAQSNMDTAREKDLVVDAGATFARNRLAIIVPRDNPGGISSPRDLAKPGLKLVLAAAEVPAGRYAREALASFGASAEYGAAFPEDVLANLASEELNVKAVVTKVQLGEADAGIVYVTDVTEDVAEDIASIEIPDEFNVIASYPIAVTAGAGEPEVAQAFIEYVRGAEGQATLGEYGFLSVE